MAFINFLKRLFKIGKHREEPEISESVAPEPPNSGPVETKDPSHTRPPGLPDSNHYGGWTPSKLKMEYEYLYSICEIQPSWDKLVNSYIEKYLDNIQRYEAISKLTGVPSKVIAVIHMKESSMNFLCHLHNGDPLSKRTVQVPAGRPIKPPANGKKYTFEESAIDALKYDGLTKVTDWSIGNTFLWLEKYNGSGYRTGAGRKTVPPNASPYIYTGTQFYISGQYVRDGKFSSTAKAKNLGCMAFLKALDRKGV